MEKKTNLHKLLFSIALLLFNWPFISITMTGKPEYSYLYLFLAWLLIILFVFFIQESDTDLSSDRGLSRQEKGGKNV